MRGRILGQLNKGETLHALRRHLVIGSCAQLPADEDDHRRHALCLQILVNAVQIWNARYMTAAIDHLHATRPALVADDRALAASRRHTRPRPRTQSSKDELATLLGERRAARPSTPRTPHTS